MNARAMARCGGADVIYEEAALADGQIVEQVDGRPAGRRRFAACWRDERRLAEMGRAQPRVQPAATRSPDHRQSGAMTRADGGVPAAGRVGAGRAPRARCPRTRRCSAASSAPPRSAGRVPSRGRRSVRRRPRLLRQPGGLAAGQRGLGAAQPGREADRPAARARQDAAAAGAVATTSGRRALAQAAVRRRLRPGRLHPPEHHDGARPAGRGDARGARRRCSTRVRRIPYFEVRAEAARTAALLAGRLTDRDAIVAGADAACSPTAGSRWPQRGRAGARQGGARARRAAGAARAAGREVLAAARGGARGAAVARRARRGRRSRARSRRRSTSSCSRPPTSSPSSRSSGSTAACCTRLPPGRRTAGDLPARAR